MAQFAGTNVSVPFAADGPGTTAITLTPFGALWGTSTLPPVAASGAHLYAPSVLVNGNLVTDFYGQTTVAYTDSGPDPVTMSQQTLDPFFLPYHANNQPIASTVISNFPDHLQQSVLVNLSATQTEGMGFYIKEDGTGAATLNKFTFLTSGTGLNAPLTVGPSVQLDLGSPLAGSDLFFSAATQNSASRFFDPATGYSVAWSQYSGGTFSINFRNFNSGDTPTTAVIPLLSAAVSVTQEPAWFFRNAGLANGTTPIYGAAIFDPATNKIHFQGYKASDGTAFGPTFDIQPDVSAFGPGATGRILQPLPSTDHSFIPVGLQFTTNIGANSGYSFAWDDTVTDSGGNIHHQVEFAIDIPSTSTLIRATPVQIADGNAQNVRILPISFLGGGTGELLVYGDNTGTHVILYNANAIPLASIFDPSTQTFGQFTTLGDGRIALVYDVPAGAGGETQSETHIYDLRGTGLTPSVFSDNRDKYFAGTQFNDTVTGEDNVSNSYYFVGSAIGGSPTDVFHGGQGTAWNTAVFGDVRANYTIAAGASTVITNIDSLHAHAGTLTVDHVQALAFNPLEDPTPLSDGSLNVTGDTLMLLGQYSGTITMENNATLELAQPSAFTWHIANFAGGNFIDLDGFDSVSTVFSYAGTNQGGTLTVSDSTHTGPNAASFVLTGSYDVAEFGKMDDGHNGVKIDMIQAVADNIIGSAGVLSEVPMTIPQSVLLANDTDSFDAQLSITAVNATAQTQGSAQLQGSNVLYTPPSGFVPPGVGQQASDSFNYTPMDSGGLKSTGTVNLTVVGGTQIAGTPGNDVFISSPLDETFVGVSGNDTFVFKPGFGHDTIADFHPGQNAIDIDHNLFANIQAVMDSVTGINGNTVITDNAGDTITLANVAPINLHPSDFHLV